MTWDDMKDRISEAYHKELSSLRRERCFPIFRPRERQYGGSVITHDGRERTGKDFRELDYTPVHKGTKKEFQEFLTKLARHGRIKEAGIDGGFDGLEHLKDDDYKPWVGEWDASFTREELVSAGFVINDTQLR